MSTPARNNKPGWSTALWPAIVCVLIVCALMTWPADAPWGGDDVSLITAATQANRQHDLIEAGLGGSFGYPYGPIPSQFYQVLVAISHDPLMLVRLHAGLFAATTAMSLLYLANVLNVSPWLAPMTMVGPFFWFYTRLMWDNTFAIPVGTLLLAAYGDYLRRPNRFSFFAFASSGIALPFIHPMTLPLAIAAGSHAVVARSGTFKTHWRGLIIIAACTAILCGPYIKRVVKQMGHSQTLMQPAADRLSRPEAFAFPLLAGRLFCADGFFDSGARRSGWKAEPLQLSRAR